MSGSKVEVVPVETSQKRIQYRLFVRIFLPLALLITIVGAAIAFIHAEGENAALEIQDAATLEIAKSALTVRLETAVTDLHFLRDSLALRRYIEQGDAWGLRDLAEELKGFATDKEFYDQVRFIDEFGNETVRIEQKNGKATINNHGLQNKSDRYYFKQTIGLDDGEIFVSRFDLNVEEKKIERPLKPVLRFATPIYDDAGHKRGIFILNYKGDKLLERVKPVLANAVGEITLLSSEDHSAATLGQAAGWAGGLGQNRTFAERYPEAWALLKQRAEGSIDTARGRFVFRTLYPHEKAHEFMHRGGERSRVRKDR